MISVFPLSFWASVWLVMVICIIITSLGIGLSLPLFKRFTMAHPNGRSSHTNPTPQGAGLVMMVVLVSVFTFIHILNPAWTLGLIPIVGFSTFLSLIGFLDDRYGLPILVRFSVQTLAVGGFLACYPEWRLLPIVPLEIERLAELIAGVGWINIVNFMDGIDLMSAAQAVPTTLVVIIASFTGILPPAFGLLAAMLLGVLLGFIPFNRPPARIFLGDSGSLPLGFLLGAMLYALAVSSTFSGAFLLALYYVTDSITTILKRLRRGEKIWQAHREHAYQRAVHLHGWSISQVSGAVFALNLLFSAAALSLGLAATPLRTILTLLIGIFGVFILLRRLEQPVPLREEQQENQLRKGV